MNFDPHSLLDIAQTVAAEAAEIHRRGREKSIIIEPKHSDLDIVTAIDRAAEVRIRERLQPLRPNDSIIGEEGSDIPGTTGICWIIDPLDGTKNYVRGYPAYAVSVGIEYEGKRIAGVVIDTYHNITYSGIVGHEALRDRVQITPSKTHVLSNALIGTGFLADAEVRRYQARTLEHLLPQVLDVRRSGSPALDLCWVASGVLDGFYEYGLGTWDCCAGAAIAQAAGACVKEYPAFGLAGTVIVVANQGSIDSLVQALIKVEAIVE